ncbi:hypothetical protein NECAME_04510 [Necator americanus]|uniref:Uncharacterized protein n=1 Tax=Necator americanus TaxID=51031 RepID=W2SRU8_NECAM|nr:hypothetical protein NECAME_04510 [Necator americanus]ETN72330.1 hypothetical protein NECAME_04510 [Necator americanus]
MPAGHRGDGGMVGTIFRPEIRRSAFATHQLVRRGRLRLRRRRVLFDGLSPDASLTSSTFALSNTAVTAERFGLIALGWMAWSRSKREKKWVWETAKARELQASCRVLRDNRENLKQVNKRWYMKDEKLRVVLEGTCLRMQHAISFRTQHIPELKYLLSISKHTTKDTN